MSMIINPYRFGASLPVNTDNFSTNTLGSYTQLGVGNWAIASGALTTTSATQSVLTRSGVSFADGEASCVVTVANDMGLSIRVQDANNYYMAVIRDASSASTLRRDTVSIYKQIAGAFTEIGLGTAIPTFTRGTPTKLTFAASGSDLTLSVNDVPYINLTDASLSGPGGCGPRSNGVNLNSFDSFTWP